MQAASFARLGVVGALSLLVGGAAGAAVWLRPLPKGMPQAFDGTQVRVIDGDTIVINGERVRIENLDAPEMGTRARCSAEVILAERAKVRLDERLQDPGATIELVRNARRPKDRYGRTLARVLIDGADVADELIAAGVARPWRGRSSNWCGGANYK